VVVEPESEARMEAQACVGGGLGATLAGAAALALMELPMVTRPMPPSGELAPPATAAGTA